MSDKDLKRTQFTVTKYLKELQLQVSEANRFIAEKCQVKTKGKQRRPRDLIELVEYCNRLDYERDMQSKDRAQTDNVKIKNDQSRN